MNPAVVVGILLIETTTACGAGLNRTRLPNIAAGVLGALPLSRYKSSYCPSQLTLLFQSTKAPLGLSRQAQTCNSKIAGIPYRFGLSTNWKAWPSSMGGTPL